MLLYFITNTQQCVCLLMICLFVYLWHQSFPWFLYFYIFFVSMKHKRTLLWTILIAYYWSFLQQYSWIIHMHFINIFPLNPVKLSKPLSVMWKGTFVCEHCTSAVETQLQKLCHKTILYTYSLLQTISANLSKTRWNIYSQIYSYQ